ncbi:NACHT domain-containing protein [Kribbella sp. ALI-6-A]|uniref:NACHT domain-containing protein n=1 Tax=Kribbella sp. ALI-6-A TaxID=1933817 RepID=UPI00143CF005|nr:NACHT domain-containing protein [Kribbella sp. ALI-6-A]
MADYYKRLRPRRLVITGAPGAGKTVLAVELIMALLEDRALGDPVPVRISASSLDLDEDISGPGAATERVEMWLVAHVMKVHRFSQRAARALVSAGQVVPVVDGLDELDATDQPGYASRAGQALRILNGYQRYRSKAELMVTCRTEHYQALTNDLTWVEGSARVEIRQVSDAQASKFIMDATIDRERWKTVLDTISSASGGPLALALSTPWRLTLAVTVYEQRGNAGFLRDPDQLTADELGTPDAIRDHLLSLFIPAVLYNSGGPYDPGRTHRWLATLAGHLNQNASTGRRFGSRRLSSTDIICMSCGQLLVTEDRES